MLSLTHQLQLRVQCRRYSGAGHLPREVMLIHISITDILQSVPRNNYTRKGTGKSPHISIQSQYLASRSKRLDLDTHNSTLKMHSPGIAKQHQSISPQPQWVVEFILTATLEKFC